MSRSILHLTAAASTFVPSWEGVLPELEGVEEPVGRHLPGFGDVTHELPVRRDVHQAAADIHRHPHHFVAGRRMEIEMGDVVPVGDPQCPATLRCLSVGGGRDDDSGENGEDDQQNEPGTS
jgi:hypothetical protein